MKQLIILLAIFSLEIVKLYAQADFRDGYIIKNNNDTVYGLIDYSGNKANSKKCIFKKDIHSEKQEFSPNELKVYRFIDSKYYVSRPLGDKDTFLFLEYLINGIVDIFYYRDEVGEHYLIDLGDDKLHELKNEEKVVYINDERFMKDTKEYVGVLKYAFRKSSAISQKVDKISLDHKSLTKIAHDYHQEVCSNEECIIYEKKLPKIITKFGALVGINAVLISESGSFSDELYYLRNTQSKKVFYPSVGVFFKVNMPNFNEKLYFRYEGTYNHAKFVTTNTYIDRVYNVNYVNTIKLIQDAFCNSGSIRYEFPKGKIRPAFQAGGFVNYFFNIDYTRNLDVNFAWGDTYYTEKNNESPFSKFDAGINIGCGIVSEMFNKKEISIDLKYQRGFGLIQGLNSDYLLLNVGFQIGK